MIPSFDRSVLFLLAVWALLFGLIAVTNFKMELMTTIMGISALALGIICLIRVFR